MSATEVIEQIKKLPQNEQQKVLEFLHAAENSGTFQKPEAKVSEEFKRLADEMFTTNNELFRKLAQ
ncbi:MAG TPA: hypothetical protein VFW05_02405 [Verrucomicrobiae bacterium]|jgi:hypothetical protein|nr:hypothetical protein [Verrucomicrobiae bacterium]